MADKVKKPKKPKFDFPVGLREMTKEEADAEMSAFFAKLEEKFQHVPQEELQAGAQKIQKFLDGNSNWAELFGFTPEMLFQMAEHGYAQFQSGRYQDAERIFKVLTVMDWENHYYHSMMGSVLQRQKRYAEAIAEFSQAITLFPEDIVSLTHRGEIYLMHGVISEAKKDLTRAVDIDTTGENRWANRARILLAHMDKHHG